MAADLDVVGGAAVDVVPIAPNFHRKLKGIVLPAADRVGEEAGRRIGEAMSRHIRVAIPDAITNGGRTARVSATRQGDDNAGAFARAFKSRLEAAFRSLPRPDVRLSTTGFDADLARVRSRMETLANKRVGVDIDAATAFAQISALDTELERLSTQTADIQVRSDIAAARAGLAEMQRAVNDLDGETATVHVRADTGSARAELLQLGILLGGVAAIPVVPVAAAGIGAIASAAVAAGAGVGALALAAVPAIKGVTEAIQAKTAAERESSRATDNSAASSVKATQSALQLANAQATLRSAHRQAAQQIADANRQVEGAERSLVDAKRAARQAEDDLTATRRNARQELRSLQDELLDGVLSEREATLRVAEAREELARVTADPTATDLQRQRAQLSLDEAVRNLDKQREKQAELKRSVEDATKAGVDGNANVKAATQRVTDAQQKVQDQTRAVADAQSRAADAQVQAAESIASAERGLHAARLSSVDTTVKSASAADDYRKALAKLTPEQRTLYDAIAGPKGLKAAFADWARQLSPDVVPLLTQAVNGAKNALPGLSPLVREAAAGVEELQDAASKDLKEPFWQGFKKDIEGAAKPAVIGLGKAFGNTLKGMAGVVDAFLPHMDGIADRMVKSSRTFANWGTGLKGSPEFERFLKYAEESGPKVAGFLGSVGGAFLAIGEALAPFSGPLLVALTGIADGIATIADHTPWLVQGIWLIIAAQKAWNIVMIATNVIMSANPVALLVAGILALAAAVYWAYQHVGWFRTAVDTSWKWIQRVTEWLWTKALQPFFAWFGDTVVWLWDKVIKPYIELIIDYWKLVGDVIVWLWTHVVKPYIDLMVEYWKMVADVISWLWSGIFSPIFGFIGDLIAWWYRNIVLKYFNLVMSIARAVGDVIGWLYQKGVKPPIDSIVAIVMWAWDKGIKPAFDKIKDAAKLVGEAFGSARDAVKAHWFEVAQIAAKPVNFIIEWVYNKGIKAVFDKVAGFVGMEPLPKGPKLLDTNPKFLAAGGTVGDGWGVARPMVTNKPTAIVGEGDPRFPEYIIPTDPKYRSRAKALWQAAGVQLLEKGGVLGKIGGALDWTKDTLSDVVGGAIDWAKTGADLMTNPGKVWDALMRPILSKVAAGVGSSTMGAAVGKYPAKMAAGIKDKITSAVSGLFSGGDGGGGGGNGPWARPVNAPFGTRFGVAGSMWSSGHHTGLDFPAPTGTPIFAVAPGTVALSRSGGPYGNHILINHGGGLASLYAHMSRMNASVGQAVTRGQTIGAVGATGNVTGPHLHFEARRNGTPIDPMPFLYDSGGYLPPGMTLVANGTGRPEPVLTSQQWADIRAAKGSGPDADGINVYVSTTLDGRELTGHVDKRIEVYDRQSATALNNGRWS
ncbi:peptidoglycan DD-metalloendopeptidase family protein [Streptomyces sp. NPDC018693]|uniref:peptidoglycan DD-metalloendopeptidase family protein n=1 Tax=unclassified Streptomyces TaxID=2593676 RepID=UPI0037B84938